jgi:tetratricopeptide (TPR) repeat protein
MTAWHRDQAAEALDTPPTSLTPDQRNRIRSLAVSLEMLGQILRHQGEPGCLPYYHEALGLYERIGGSHEEAELAINLGNACMAVPGLRDLDQAEHWFRHALSLRTDSDWLGQAKSFAQLGAVALGRFDDAHAAGEAQAVLLKHLNAALRSYQQDLDLTPADDHEGRSVTEHQLGIIFMRAGDTRQALRHFQQSLKHEEARGNIYGAGLTRFGIAVLLAEDGRTSDALQYARAALRNFEQAGPGASDHVGRARQLIADLEQHNADT